MPPRAALNAFYAWRVDGLDSKQRDEFDAKLYGWDEVNKRADQALMATINAPDTES